MPTATHTGAPLVQSISPTSHRLPVLHGDPAMQPATHMPEPSQLPPVHTVPLGS
jgi:hypothetical protein